MTHIIGGVISNNPCQPPYKCLWVTHWDVIQIIKHNGNNDAFLKPCFLPDMTAVRSTQPTNPPDVLPPPSSSSSQMNPMSPSHLFWGRARTELLGWIISFPRAFCHKKNLFISEGSRYVTASSVSPVLSRHDAGLPIWKGFEVRGLEVSLPSFPWPDSKQSNYSFVRGRQGWCADDIFPLSCFVVADPKGRKDCQNLTSADFSLSLSSVQATKKITE